MFRRSAAPLLVALGCIVATAVVWLLAFQTGAGAQLDSTVLRGFTGLNGSRLEPLAAVAVHFADPLPSALLTLAILAIAVIRRRSGQALVVIVVLAGANLTTQLLKPLATVVRPTDTPQFAPLADAWPSGHTTAAMTLALCLVVVAPPRWRPVAAAGGGLFAVAQGYGLLVMGWHYPSDVLAAFAVATGWVGLGVAVLRATSARTEASSLHLRTVFGPAALAALAGTALAAGIVLVRPARALDYAEDNLAFVAAAAVLGLAGLALAAVTAAALPVIERGARVSPDAVTGGQASDRRSGP